MKNRSLVLFFFFSLSWVGPGQEFTPPANRNAALQYWVAFAQLKDAELSPATLMLVDNVLSGAAAWDEKKLGPIVEQNLPAIRTMQQAIELPECNWGLDYSLGAEMPIAHLPKARVLARLNALYGVRQMAEKNPRGAVHTWLTGLRFSQDVGKDVGLIGVLSSRMPLDANLRLLANTVPQLSSDLQLKKEIKAALDHLPPEGLDWSMAIRSEGWADEAVLKSLAKAPDFPKAYKALFAQESSGARRPTEEDVVTFKSYMNEVEQAFRLPPAKADDRLKQLSGRVRSMSPVLQTTIPHYEKLNQVRGEVLAEIVALRGALK